MNNIKCRPEALVIADALELLDTGMCSPRDGAAELRRQRAETERLTSERDALRDVTTELIACLIAGGKGPPPGGPA